MREAWRADLALVGFVGAVGHQVDTELALRRLDRGVDFPGGNVKAFGIELEVMDQRLHRTLHLTAPWRNDLVVLDHDRSLTLRGAQLLDALLYYPHGLAHFLHAD